MDWDGQIFARDATTAATVLLHARWKVHILCAQFLDYSANEEIREKALYGLRTKSDVWREPFMPELREQIEWEFSWIERRLRENREKFEDDLTIEVAENLDLDPDEPEAEQDSILKLCSELRDTSAQMGQGR